MLSRYVQGIMARVFAHQDVTDLARHGSVPVINGLSDLLHPCQALADYFTLRERRGGLSGLKLAYVGDGNNVAHELMFGAVKLGLQFSIGCPKGYEPNPLIFKSAVREAQKLGSPIPEVSGDPFEAVAGADVVYTDVWTSMGQEAEAQARLEAFRGFEVTPEMMAAARPDAMFMHCLPAHRGEEVSADVIDGPQSVVFDEAENRLHVQKAILVTLMGQRTTATRSASAASSDASRPAMQPAAPVAISARGHVVLDHDPSDRGRQHEGDAAGAGLLVVRDRLEEPGRRQVGHAGPRADVVDGRGDRVEVERREQPAMARDPGRADEAPADRLAVGEAPVAGHRLERVAEGVAEVQDVAQAALALVALDDVGLDPAGGGDRVVDLRPRPAARARPGRRRRLAKSASSPSTAHFRIS